MEHGGLTRVGGRENSHSRMGIASFVIGILAFVVMVILFVVFGVFVSSVLEGVDLQNPQSIDPQSLQNSPEAVWLGLASLGILGCLLLFFVGLVLGVAGIFQRRRKRLFAVLGTLGNGFVLLVFVALFVLGFALGGVGGGA